MNKWDEKWKNEIKYLTFLFSCRLVFLVLSSFSDCTPQWFWKRKTAVLILFWIALLHPHQT